MPYPNDNRLNVIISQTSASADSSGKFPFTERIISGSNLFIVTDASGNLTGSTSIPGGSFTNLTVTGALTASIISASNSIITNDLTTVGNTILGNATSDTIQITGSTSISGSLTVIGNIAGTIDSASAVTIAPINNGSIYYVTFVDSTTGVRQLKTDSDILSYTPLTNALTVGTAVSGSLTIGSKLNLVDSTASTSLSVGVNTTDTASLTVSSNAFRVIKGQGPGVDKVFTNLELTASNNALFSNTTQATDWTSGALNVIGGVGIGKNLYVSGSINAISGVVIATGSILTFNGTGSSTYASSSTLGYFSDGNFNDFLIQSNNVPRVRIGGTTGNITFNNINGSNILVLSTSTSSLYSGNVTIDSNGNMVLASDLAVNGGDITTTAATATLFNTNASQVNIGGGAITQVLLGNAVGTVKTAGDLVLGINNAIKDTSGNLGLTVSSSLTTVAGDLRVGGNDIQDNTGVNNLILSSTRVNVPLTTQATDWTTGALTVAGGVGIGKNLYVSGSTFLYGDLTIFGTGSVVNISSSNVIIGDNRIVLNAGTPVQRYAGLDVYDSGSGTYINNITSSLLWDGLTDNWVIFSANSSSGTFTTASSVVIGGPVSQFGSEGTLTSNVIPKVQSTGKNLQNSLLSDNGTTLSYAGTAISTSQVTASQLTVQYTGSVTYATGVYITYTTGSFTTITITTGSSPGVGDQVPASPTAAGLAGQINVDNNFIYVYTNQVWKRVPLSTWLP